MFCVSVPVLSAQMQEVNHKVSIASRFFISTDFFDIRSVVSAIVSVKRAEIPSGTYAIMIPIA